MYKKNKFQLKVIAYLLPAVLLVIILIGVFVAVNNKGYVLKNAKDNTKIIAQRDKKKVDDFFNSKSVGIQAVAAFLSGESSELTPSLDANYDRLIMTQIRNNPSIDNVWVLWYDTFANDTIYKQGWYWKNYSIRGVENVRIKSSDQFISMFSGIVDKEKPGASNPFIKNGKLSMMMGQPIVHNGGIKGYVGFEIKLDNLVDVLENDEQEVNTSIITNEGLFIYNVDEEKVGKTFKQVFTNLNEDIVLEKKIASGETFDMENEFEDVVYYSRFEPLLVPGLDNKWAIEVRLPYGDLLAGHGNSVLKSVLFALILVVFLAIFFYFVVNRMLSPINKVREALNLLSAGNIKGISEINIKGDDELVQIADSLNNVVGGLKKTENFALQIGNGNIEHEYEIISEYDQLGKALISMRESLRESREEQLKHKQEEERSTWANVGIAKFSETLRKDTDDMHKLGFNLISNLVDYLGVNQGAMFVEAENEEYEDRYFELVTAIAYGRDKYLNKKIKIGEGLIGRCIYECKTIYLTEIPEKYINITSGLGTASPKSVLIVPCTLEDSVYGVIEIASFKTFEQHEIEFVEKLASSIASTISNVRMNEKTSKLLKDSQHQSEELAAQEEELRQNLEEMEATQEDLKRQMEENSEMRKNLEKQNALLDALLSSIPDYIYFKDEESKFLRISESMLEVFNASEVSEVIGKSDFDYQAAHLAEVYYNEEKEIIRSGKGFVDKLQCEHLVDGTEIWTTITKLPLFTENGDCIGTFGISKNVTDFKLMELEAKKQSALLDALLDSLPDYVYFKDEESKFLRISKSMLHIFDAKSVTEIEGKSDFDFQPEESARIYYNEEKEIMRTRNGIVNKVLKEKLVDGSIIWNTITKLPIVTSEGECIGTFGISKNITEIKELEQAVILQKEDLNNLLNEIPAEIYLKDEHGKYIVVNDARAARFGKKASEIIGITDAEFVSKEEEQNSQKENLELIKNKRVIVEDEKNDDGHTIKRIKKPFVIQHLNSDGVVGLRIDVDEIESI